MKRCLPLLLLALPSPADAGECVLTPRLHHLRAGPEREWADFPEKAEAPKLTLSFPAERNAGEWSLRLRQQDVKQTWKVLLNGKELGRLPTDENDMVVCLPVAPGRLVSGKNTLVVEPAGRTPDDVRVGEVVLADRPVKEALGEATVEVTVVDGDRPGPLPCRITVVNEQGALMTVGAASGGKLAVRPGVIYTGDGTARFGLPAGEYTIYAGRGFEYGLDRARLTLRPGDMARKQLTIRREVPTPGHVSCDPHVHTLTYSGHGDATIDERIVTIAGEGIELPVAAEHNRQVDYQPAAEKLGLRHYFTPVVGNEVTTPVGHFNIFPVRPDGPIPDFRVKDWKSAFAGIGKTGAKVVILNHPRDLHSGFRPFGAERHLALTGEDQDGWELRANAMEVVNSGAQQSDPMRLVHDWFGLLNRGLHLAPVGASDSHDVARHFVGQARTYVRCPDDDPGNIDVAEAVQSFQEGRVLVSCGLLADIRVNGKHGPGDLAPAAKDVKVSVRVHGPGWVKAEKVELYANGRRVREALMPDEQKAGVKWSGEWVLPSFKHDVHLVAVATGPGVTEPYWPIARPYQPISPRVQRKVIGVTGAVWLDADGDGKRTCAYEYARRLFRAAAGDGPGLVRRLADYDEAVAAQVAGLLRRKGTALHDAEIREAARKAGPQVEAGFQAFAEAWRESQIARTRPR